MRQSAFSLPPQTFSYPAHANTFSSNTFAPFAQSFHDVSSFGEWLIPATLGTKIIPIGVNLAIICASCPAQLGRCIVENRISLN